MSDHLRSLVTIMFLGALCGVLLIGCPAVTPAPPDTPPDQPGAPPETGVVAQPVFSPAAGTYTSAQSVTITTSTSGAQIRYTTDGNQPTESSTLYTGAIAVSSSTTLRAVASKSDLMSSFATATYTITGKVATPSITPSSNTFTAPVEVSMSCSTSGAEIHYTVNGGTPTASDPVYAGPFTVSATSTVRAIAMETGWENSTMASATFTITIPPNTAATPTFSPAGGLYYADQSVMLEAASGATIYYTTDGSDPTTSSTQYSGPFTVNKTNTQIRAYVVDPLKTNPSSIVSATYRLKVATPIASPDPSAGAVAQGTSVTLSCATEGATIYYDPAGGDTLNNVYIDPISLDTPTIPAKAVKSDYEDSDILFARYGLKTYVGYTDGSGHLYQLVRNGADVDITSMFEHAAASMSFAVNGSTTMDLYYAVGGHVYQFVKAGSDTDVTSTFESFTSDSVLYPAMFGSSATPAYKVGSRLYSWSSSGTDADATPSYFSATSEVYGPLYTDGTGKVYGLGTEIDYSSMFDYIEPQSHLRSLGSTASYTAGGKLYDVVMSGQDTEFDSSEFEHFTSVSYGFSLSALFQ